MATVSTTPTKSSWALEMERDEQMQKTQTGPLPKKYETKPDEKGIKTVVEYKWKDGRQVKVTKRYQVTEKITRTNRALETRRAWKKFGNARDARPGPEPGFTGYEDNVRFEFTDTFKKMSGKVLVDDALVNLIKTTVSNVAKTIAPPPSSQPSASAEETSTNANVYVPPSKRRDANTGSLGGGSGSGSGTGLDQYGQAEGCTVRVSNLSPEVSEDQLRFYFGRCGHLRRVFLAKDRETQISKGYAFITFERKEDAETAVRRMNGFGLSHLIIQVEWAND